MTPPDVELILPAERESVAVARQVVRGVTARLQWDDGRAGDIAIAVTEACTNAVLHAYPSRDDGEYRVLVWAADEELVVSVIDDGDGVAPKVPSAKAGLGLGLPLMVSISDEVSFARGDAGNEVRLTFRREPSGEDA